MNKKILSVFAILFLVLLVGQVVFAQTYKQDSTINIQVHCSKLNCSNPQNISIFSPSSFPIELNEEMTFSDGFFSYSFDETNSLGEYRFFISDGVDSYEGVFVITPTGYETTTAHALLYGLMILVCVFFMVAFLVGAFAIDGNNKFTMGGDLVEVNLNKYFKLGLGFGAYLFAIFVSYFAWQTAMNFLLLDFGSEIFRFIFITLWIMLFPILILIIIVGFMKWLLDVELHKLSLRGLPKR